MPRVAFPLGFWLAMGWLGYSTVGTSAQTPSSLRRPSSFPAAAPPRTDWPQTFPTDTRLTPRPLSADPLQQAANFELLQQPNDPQPNPGLPQGGGLNPQQPDLTAPVGQRFILRPTTFTGDLTAKDIYINRPDLVEDPLINPKNKSEVVLTGRKLGLVRVTFMNPDRMEKAERSQSYLVQIVPDVIYLNGLVKARFPTANLNVVAAGDNVLFVDGTVDNPNDAIEVERLLQRYFTGGVVNNVRVGGAMQVQLEVVIARVDRTQLRRLGINPLYANRESFFGSQVGNLINVPPVSLRGSPAGSIGATFSPVGTGGPVLNGSVTTFFGVTNDNNALFGFIEALKQRNVAKVLANPTLVTMSGRPADFLVGGEQPIPTAVSLGVPSVTFKPFGTRLSFLPTILGDGRIRLDVVPEVSTTNFANSISVAAGGGQIPQFVTQRLHATVELQSGQTLCLGGLLQTDHEAQVDKVPLLGSLPVIGAAFRRVRYRSTESELLIIITPRLFDPLRGCQVPSLLPGQESRSPSDVLLFGHGQIETEVPSTASPGLGDGIPVMQPPGEPDSLPYPVVVPPPPMPAATPAPASKDR